MKISLVFLAVAAALVSGSCSQTKPKTLGKRKLDFSSTDTATADTFKFNFAYRDASTTDATLKKIVYLQGAANTKTPIVSTCNNAGTNCVCDFYNNDTATPRLLESTSNSNDISYDVTGNYIRCNFNGTLSDLDSVVIRNQNSTVVSAVYSVETTLSAAKILGEDLDLNRLRTIYRYGCVYSFLQKAATSSTSFDCSNQGSQCWNNPGVASGDFCILKSVFPFHLYSDNYSSNISLKQADRLYNQGGSDRLCGVQVKQFDCATAAGNLSAQFGLYSEQVGIFEQAVQLSAGPDIAVTTYGFAAKTSTFNGQTVCPPGMERQVFYRASTVNVVTNPSTGATNLGVASNYPNGNQLTEIASPTGSGPAAVTVEQIIGRKDTSVTPNVVRGDCGGSSCILPDTSAGALTGTNQQWSYSKTGEIEFCVIPTALLP